jgi:hypothetical protein
MKNNPKNKYQEKYSKPPATAVEKMTPDEIIERLEDYEEIENWENVPLQTHIRYFKINDDGTKVFRMGGWLVNNSGLPIYVVLANSGTSWSIQTKEVIGFKQITVQSIREQYEKIIKQLKDENKKIISEKNKLIAFIKKNKN